MCTGKKAVAEPVSSVFFRRAALALAVSAAFASTTGSEVGLIHRCLYTQHQFALMPQTKSSMPASAGNLAVLWRKTGSPELYCSDLRQRQHADLYVYPRHPQQRLP